ncbi:hypothetical protein CEXT_761271 [Caerostris extrusa]|uniref:Uncharacterized protein n=1 Tax=Caerostris extrusa TaxID=172846 RepID=A0AAV4WXC2_CAEEX|nr:hypothetical protein CEXT_761271 [Caerostris extrusa]
MWLRLKSRRDERDRMSSKFGETALRSGIRLSGILMDSCFLCFSKLKILDGSAGKVLKAFGASEWKILDVSARKALNDNPYIVLKTFDARTTLDGSARKEHKVLGEKALRWRASLSSVLGCCIHLSPTKHRF